MSAAVHAVPVQVPMPEGRLMGWVKFEYPGSDRTESVPVYNCGEANVVALVNMKLEMDAVRVELRALGGGA